VAQHPRATALRERAGWVPWRALEGFQMLPMLTLAVVVAIFAAEIAWLADG
jgi:hypothetical protein